MELWLVSWPSIIFKPGYIVGMPTCLNAENHINREPTHIKPAKGEHNCPPMAGSEQLGKHDHQQMFTHHGDAY